MNDNYFENEGTFEEFDLGNTEETDYNPFETDEEEQAEPAPISRFSEVKKEDCSRETEVDTSKEADLEASVGIAHEENPFTAALSKAEEAQAQLDAGSLFSKCPVFDYGGAVDEIENANISFEQLRIEKSADFPELEDGKKISWTMEYGSIKKSVVNPKDTIISKLKTEIETSKEFLEALKKAKDKNPACKVKPTIRAQSKGIASYLPKQVALYKDPLKKQCNRKRSYACCRLKMEMSMKCGKLRWVFSQQKQKTYRNYQR